MHSLSGSVLLLTGEQTPSAPVDLAAEQAWQVPVQAVLQQKPSTQKPDWHCVALVQATPCGSSR